MLLGLSILNIVDIFLVSLLLFYLYKMMKDSGSLNLFLGIFIFVLVWLVVAHVIKMPLLGSIMDALANVGVLALIIIFQEEIRHFFRELGSQKRFRKFVSLFSKDKSQVQGQSYLPIVRACQSMAEGKVGALIAVERTQHLGEYIQTGELIDANINRMLIENIFFKNSPLHDGAMIVSGDKIVAAGCVLPISHREDIPKRLGLRHRAALGLSEVSDAIVIVVSEETGHISVAHDGEFELELTAEALESILSKEQQ
ncbi:MAG: diadenylate cyclase CdaA [Bacteroidaceae bacterium]|nr:diadenylate cyclase CdaA [Bacteroidaceae bacterium]